MENRHITSSEFSSLNLKDKIEVLFKKGSFILNIRYYGYKVNLYLLSDYYVEVFYNHKKDIIEKIDLMDPTSNRINFYADQITLPKSLFNDKE